MKKSILTILRIIAISIPFLLFSSLLSPVLKACPPNLSAMDETFYASLQKNTETKKVTVSIFPFQDGTPGAQNPDLLAHSFSFIFNDLLEAYMDVGILHPFVTMEATKDINQESLFDEVVMGDTAATLNTTYALFGLFQKLPQNQVRYFVKIFDVKQKKLVGTILEFTTSEDNIFFATVNEAVGKVAKTMGLGKISKGVQEAYLKTAPTYEGFRFYIKGMKSSAKYNKTSLEVSNAWFEKASNTGYSFAPTWREWARVHFMLSQIKKQEGLDFFSNYAEGERLYNLYDKRKKHTPTSLNPARFIEAAKAYASGLSLLQSGSAQAYDKLLQATKLVPEDALAQNFLKEAAIKSGKTAPEADSIVGAIAPCVP